MWLLFSGDGDCTLEDGANFKTFKLVSTLQKDRLVERYQPQILAFDGNDHAWISESFVRATASGRVEPDWDARFREMLDWAARHGWVKEGCVRAHVEWTQA
ncbi:hypothetical protein OKW38_000389 [Paraburkholderia sp. MM5496-R1]|uniref:hypothetical protein n=1 Tax=Paraburkholderia sp. MM5496-R1 TaxID=2991065 RepID=UPI003D24C994